jgi:PmbA protein
MSSVDEIAAALKKTLSEAAEWRFTVKSANSVDIGVDDSKLGGPYSPPRSSTEITGNVFVIWEDGRCSRGRIDSGILNRLPREMELWRSLAYRDDDAALHMGS